MGPRGSLGVVVERESGALPRIETRLISIVLKVYFLHDVPAQSVLLMYCASSKIAKLQFYVSFLNFTFRIEESTRDFRLEVWQL
jgi:hypothetical protein